MIKQYIHIAVLLASAWDIYMFCQAETLLPTIAGLIMAITFLLRIGAHEQQFKIFERVSLPAVIIFSLGAGYFFRLSFPIPENIITPFPEFTAGVQSATIIASVIFWLKPFKPANLYLIIFMGWLTVALSINVPYTQPLFFKLSLFCLLSVTMIILTTFRRPDNRKYLFTYFRDFIGYSVTLVGATIVLFFGISRSIVVLDDAFMTAMRDYVVPQHYSHFLNISPKLNLINPGLSAFDKRPVLEVSAPDVTAIYLKTQVFEKFNNGVWEEPKDQKFSPVPDKLVEGDTPITLTMFTPLKDIVPSPADVTGVEANGWYEMDQNQIVYGREQRYTRILKFSTKNGISAVAPTLMDLARNTELPAAIAQELKAISSSIVGEESTGFQKALALRDFFNNGFQYSLNVSYSMDNRSLLAMIKEKKPAYCTYFATAMALLLRAEGIPARVATGFYTDEMIDRRKSLFLARVRHAHAWVEVLLPAKDPRTGERFIAWATIDPTPSSGVNTAPEERELFEWEKFYEGIWLGLLRYSATLQNIDKEKAKVNLIMALAGWLLLMNAREIIAGIKRLLEKKRKQLAVVKAPAHLQVIYKHYEQYLKKTFGETRQPAETDREVIARLKARPELAPETIAKAESFLEHYHAARFGERDSKKLEEMLK